MRILNTEPIAVDSLKMSLKQQQGTDKQYIMPQLELFLRQRPHRQTDVDDASSSTEGDPTVIESVWKTEVV